jgi:protein-S-isoprenylcysteine O-methyltransferase Ste14
MKKRIQIDGVFLAFVIIMTAVIFKYPNLYLFEKQWDPFANVLGIILILKGIFFRMAARGHKKAHSRQGSGLVTTGLYSYTRNPMYWGTFIIGLGFVLIVWPFWIVPVFAVLFYGRFIRQIKKEEKHLEAFFPKEYPLYCREVRRFLPQYFGRPKINFREVMPLKEIWDTKERKTLYYLPFVAIVLECIHQRIIFGAVDLSGIARSFLVGVALFSFIFGWFYLKKD